MIIEDNKRCTGCSACVSICPQSCIKMMTNDEGFLYPVINKEKCFECGLCEKICTIDSTEYNEISNEIYAFSNCEEIRNKSTSGGFFSLISDYVLDKNGMVYGAGFDDDFNVKHIRATNKKERENLKYSKYVQSNITGIYECIKEDLQDRHIVLFTGTPCQVSGLNNYLICKKINTERLITCDFLCHGTPSPLIWKNYLHFIESKYNDQILAINFRDKELGWHKPRLKIVMNNHIQALTELQDPYYQLFYSNCILRESCHVCDYSKKSRVADITMGDCWGIEKAKPQLDDNKGLSLIIPNSAKGLNMIKLFINEPKIKFDRISFDDINQPHLTNPVKKSKKRDKFWLDYYNKGFLYILNNYGNYSIKSKIITTIKRKIIKVLLK